MNASVGSSNQLFNYVVDIRLKSTAKTDVNGTSNLITFIMFVMLLKKKIIFQLSVRHCTSFYLE